MGSYSSCLGKRRRFGVEPFQIAEEVGMWGYWKRLSFRVKRDKVLLCYEGYGQTLLQNQKKLIRARAEREILQSLDQPFLPTLYSHFETEKFLCLVMEFCPGGDLHTLRQQQPGKRFSEQAVKCFT